MLITFFLSFWNASEEHIIRAEVQHILIEERRNGVLCQTNRVKLIGHLCEFIFTKLGPYPEKNNKISVEKSTVKLFPSLEYKAHGADPIVALICRNFQHSCEFSRILSPFQFSIQLRNNMSDINASQLSTFINLFSLIGIALRLQK